MPSDWERMRAMSQPPTPASERDPMAQLLEKVRVLAQEEERIRASAPIKARAEDVERKASLEIAEKVRKAKEARKMTAWQHIMDEED